MQPITSFDKAIVAGLVSALTAEAARYGFHTGPETVTALGVILTAVVPYVVAHLAVYFKLNKL